MVRVGAPWAVSSGRGVVVVVCSVVFGLGVEVGVRIGSGLGIEVGKIEERGGGWSSACLPAYFTLLYFTLACLGLACLALADLAFT